jgi:uncharacterized protein (AIM24 family)
MIKKLFIFFCAGVLILSGSFFSTAEAQLTAPTLSATAVSNSQIYLTWTDNNNGVYGYVIERSLSPGGGFVELANVSRKDTAYYDIGLASGTTYYYRIMAYKRNETSSYSGVAGATTQSSGVTIPNAPSNLTAAAGSSSQINLSWQDNSSNETGFKIQRATSSSGPWAQIATVGANTSSYPDAGLSASTTYYYRVFSYNSAGNSGYSNVANTTTQSSGGTTVPDAPSNLTANTVSSSQINLTWQDNSTNETAFEIWRYTGSRWITLPVQSANVTSYTDEGLSPSTLYFYAVRAVNSAGVSSWSSLASATTSSGESSDRTPPSVSITTPPSGSTYTTSQTVTIYATASDNVGVTKVEFYDNGVIKGTDTTNAYTYAWTFATADNGTHNWTAKAYDSAGNVAVSTAVSYTVNVPVADTTPPTVPSTLTASAVSCSQVNLSWTASTDTGGSGLKGYNVYRGGTYLKQILAPSTSTPDTGLSASHSYSYTVSAIDNAGNQSAQSNSSVIITPSCTDTIPPSVTITSPASGMTYSTAQTVTIVASASDNVGVSKVEFYDGTTLKATDTSSPYTYSWAVTSANNGTHSWTAKAYDVAGNSASSGAVGLTVNIANSSDGQTVWAERIGGTWGENVNGVAIDADGNIFVTGYFQGTVNFGGGSLSSAGGQDIFVAKYSANGDHLWSRSFGSVWDDTGYGVAIDADGDIFVTGYFQGTVNFGGGSLSSAGGQDIFVAKYSGTNGNHLWSRTFGSSGSDDGGNGVAVVDNIGNVTVTGYFRNTVDFGGGPLTSAGGSDIFVAKYSGDNGNHIWSKRFGNTSEDVGSSLKVDSGNNIIVTGSFSRSVDFGDGPLSSAGLTDIFVAKFTTSGMHQWSESFGGTGFDQGSALAITSGDNVVLTGNFGYLGSTLDFGGGSLITFGDYDIFVAMFRGIDGSHMWSRSGGGWNVDYSNGVAVDGNDVIIVGSFIGPADFGNGEVFQSAHNIDLFVAKYSGADGSYLWAQTFGGYGDDKAFALAADSNGDTVVSGLFLSPSVDFGGVTLYNQGLSDIFMLKLGP